MRGKEQGMFPMRKAKASVLAVMLWVLPSLLAFADEVVFPANPVGEKLYREHTWPMMLPPVLIIAGALIVARVIHKRPPHNRETISEPHA